ncbi:tripartite tricarboxylate transporter TctB family protein [Aureimonas sp. ME7]|uniref:tripartite tricarboxylate transporter TctB family protein n=1 Tax=Aureimonas sp. ME7 TaxID=2744252 RepID=UPI0015F70BFD|nr:tripartite tricarboxylate transporter TctB family protein [Aureimonas sp. ME7]
MRSPSALAGGLTLLALAAVALWLTRDLTQGTLDEIGSGLLPRWLAIGVGACGLALLLLSVLRRGAAFEPLPLRGPVVLSIAILAFAVLVRAFSIGGMTLPGLGLVVAGPVAVFVSGLASDEADWLELAILAPGLTAFCMVLFGDLLSLQIPLYPDALLASFPPGWSPKAVLRVVAAVLALVAAAFAAVAWRRRARHGSSLRREVSR